MTTAHHPRGAHDTATAPGTAHATATAAAARSGVTIRTLTAMDDLSAACELLDRVWGLGPGQTSEIQPPLLRALEHAGSYVVGGYRDDHLVAASVGFLAAPIGRGLHSHITGVLPQMAGKGVGAAIKWHQRAWALDRGLDTVTWTYDPLIARNSYFNVTRLGARPREYLIDFYGLMTDELNAGQPSDRALAVWELNSRSVLDAAAGSVIEPDVSSAHWRLVADPAGRPEIPPSDNAADTIDTVLVAVPPDVEALRRSDPDGALAWRLALRECLAPLIADPGRLVTGFLKSGAYVLSRRVAGEP